MNQILFCKIKKGKKFILLKIQFIISLLLFILLSICFVCKINKRNKKDIYSKYLAQKFKLNNLYLISSNTNSSIIGVIEINKIDVKYPIFAYYTDELLKLSPCKFLGPSPNEIGNLCILGHNYNDSSFFSKINELENGDIIKIYDNSGNFLEYTVYNKYIENINNMLSTSQNTNGNKEITLITCTNFGYTNRLIIKAKSGSF